jgi:hypothetical protein
LNSSSLVGGGGGGNGGKGGFGGGGNFGLYFTNQVGQQFFVDQLQFIVGAPGTGGNGGNAGTGGSGGGVLGIPGALGSNGQNGGRGQDGANGETLPIFPTNLLTVNPIPTLPAAFTVTDPSFCTNSEITLTKEGGNWFFFTATFVKDLSSATSSFDFNSPTIKIFYSTAGVYDIGISNVFLTGYLSVVRYNCFCVILSFFSEQEILFRLQ